MIVKYIFQPNNKHLYAVTIIAIFMANNHIKRDQAADTLRTVTPDKAFYFYRAEGQPLGAASRSFSEFAATVKGIDPASVRFHVERGDFESWFRMLGDKSLAGQVAALRSKKISPDELRAKVSSTVRSRVSELQKIAE